MIHLRISKQVFLLWKKTLQYIHLFVSPFNHGQITLKHWVTFDHWKLSGVKHSQYLDGDCLGIPDTVCKNHVWNQLCMELATSSCKTLIAIETRAVMSSVVVNSGSIRLSGIYGTREERRGGSVTICHTIREFK